ncbi:hypothetical protein JWG45_11310 [Leptospira sp. 201903070]|uniref:Lipoprotein n=1 Tax=Leptospira ainlahdjerensis TaxID=2810033 RepID=A0ABS2UBE4_9LEPT|nr:hypothetical protein [Leptospira ainlahdjerensis]MBM9577680.1 hypothetical protein [Leptospira ainlahdjerensis]MBM9577740.1 hypothetical protein [Leptospira ainlahdjerensis]
MILTNIKKITIVSLIVLGIFVLSCEDEDSKKALTSESVVPLLTSGQGGTVPSAVTPNPGESTGSEPVLLSVTPSPGSVKVFSLTDLGYLPLGQTCTDYDLPSGDLQEGEEVKVRQIQPTTSGHIVVEALFDRPVTSKSYRLDMRIGSSAGSGTFTEPTRPNSNTIRFSLPFQHEFPGISRLSTDFVDSNADNELSFHLAERPANSPFGMGNLVHKWKSTEKFEAPYDSFNAKVSFVCESAEASDCYAKVKYRLPSFENMALLTDIKDFSLTVLLTHPSNGQTIGRGHLDMADCYFLAKQNSSHVWYYEAKVKLNQTQALFTPQDLVSGNYKVEIRNDIQFGLLINGAPYIGNVRYKNSDILRE